MIEAALTPDRILDAAEETLTRYGPAKTTVVDVARALGVSHGSVYRHFPSKAALRDAVTERWLARFSDPLARIAKEDTPAPERLRRWFDVLIAAKRNKMKVEPELFATYHAIFAESREVIRAHVDTLSGQITRIVADGIARGEFAPVDPMRSGQAIFYATARFHDPSHAAEWNDPGIDTVFESVWALILRGLRPTDADREPRRSKR
jgi:AcrR family transcriptional regulator